jgi:hypothetical protein
MSTEYKNAYLMLSYITHMLCEFFLCLYVFIIPKKYDIYYALYISLLILLKLIFKYECIINYFDKKLIESNYVLGSNPKYVPYKQTLYNDNKYFISFINCLIILNLILIFSRNKSNLIRIVCVFNIIMWVFIEYKTQTFTHLKNKK